MRFSLNKLHNKDGSIHIEVKQGTPEKSIEPEFKLTISDVPKYANKSSQHVLSEL